MSLASKLIHGTFWTLSGGVLSRIMAVGTAAVLGRLLGKENLGYYGIVATTVLLIAPLAGGPIGVMATRYISLWKAADKARCGKILLLAWISAALLGIILAAGLWLSAGVLAEQVLQAPIVRSYLRLATPFMLFGTMVFAGNGILVGFQAYKQQALLTWMTTTVTLIATSILVWRYGVPGGIVGLNISGAMGAVGRVYVSIGQARAAGLSLGDGRLREVAGLLWSFGVPSAFCGILGGPVYWVGNVLLMRSPGGASEMGLFHAASYLRGLILFLPAAVTPVMLPLMVQALTDVDDGKSFRRVAALNARIIGLLAFPVATFVLVASRGVMVIVFGPQFADGWAVLSLIVCSLAVEAVASSMWRILISQGRMWVAMSVNLWTAGVFVLLGCLLVPTWGAVGLAATYALAYFQHAIIILAMRSRAMQAPILSPEKRLLSGALALLIAAGCGAIALSLTMGLIVGIPLAIVGAAGLLWLGFDRRERSTVANLIRSRIAHRLRPGM